ncbi:MAG: PadR family transcriptional regulator [Gemmatimonadota bacterium]
MEVKRLTDVELLLLLSVLRAGESAHASSIQEVLATQGERTTSLGSLYVTLTRLEERGLIESSKGAPTAERGGKAKRFYAVTPAGLAALHRTRSVFERMWADVPQPERG